MPSSLLIQSIKARPDRVESFLDLVSFFSPFVRSLHSQNVEKNPSSHKIQSTDLVRVYLDLVFFCSLFRSHC
ncbi:hypothetical protein LguiB_002984 [Lonicera macranthoides]